MKTSRILASSVMVILANLAMLFSCAGDPDLAHRESSDRNAPDVMGDIPPEIAELLDLWEEAVRTRNPDLLHEILGEDATLLLFERNGERTEMRGFEALVEFRLHYFADLGPQEDYSLGEMEFYEEITDDYRFLLFFYPEGDLREGLAIRLIEGRWKVVRNELLLPTPGSWVTNRYQALADENRDGFLSGHEQNMLHEMTFVLHEGPHDIQNPVDEFFDADRNGFIDDEELQRAREVHFFHAFRFWRDFNYEAAAGFLDLDGDGEVSDRELEEILEFMSGKIEIPEERERFLELPPWIPFADASFQPVPREVSNLIDELADGNGDGVIDEGEQDFILESLSFPPDRPRSVETPFDEAADRQRNGTVDHGDILLLLQASATGRGFVAEGAEPPYEAITPVDRLLDRNGDGEVDAEEIEVAILAFAGDPGIIGELGGELADSFHSMELEKIRDLMLHPRPVNPEEPFDIEMDANRDGFIDPGELGITAGVTSKGEVPPFGERIAMLRHREGPEERDESSVERPPGVGSEYYRKLGSIQDKKLAVVSLDLGTDKVDQETARGMIVFVENAFVNVGKVKVVDRVHIEDIFDEYAFQASGVIDESTAVEIGKLSGADIIVIGSINRVGGIFYLNIKLIAVETAEIIGSSIAQAEDATGFLEMTNQAVYTLF